MTTADLITAMKGRSLDQLKTAARNTAKFKPGHSRNGQPLYNPDCECCRRRAKQDRERAMRWHFAKARKIDP